MMAANNASDVGKSSDKVMLLRKTAKAHGFMSKRVGFILLQKLCTSCRAGLVGTLSVHWSVVAHYEDVLQFDCLFDVMHT